MIKTDKKIRLVDDTGGVNGYTEKVKEILYEDKIVIVCKSRSGISMIYKKDGQVVSNELDFFYAENFE